MAYDEKLADRVLAYLKGSSGLTQKRMFGGIAFMLNGNMACGIVGERLMLRLGEAGASKALEADHVAPMDFTGKPLKTMVYVEAEGFRTKRALATWLDRAIEFASSLPAK